MARGSLCVQGEGLGRASLPVMSQAPKRSLVVEWADPAEIQRAAMSGRYRTGRDLLQAMVDGEVPAPPITSLLDYAPTEIDDGRVVFEGRPGEQHYNPMGTVHGGVAATMLDTAMACAVHTQLPLERGYTTLELKINYVRPIFATTGTLRAEGKVVHLGKRTALAEGRLEDVDGKLLAHGTTTCLILE